MAGSYLPSLGCLFLFFFFFCFSYVLDENKVEASRRVFLNPNASEPSIASKEYRTAYHFQPPSHWINDPNGPMYYNGFYHLFYQYNPNAAVWGNISWAHSISTDLINWVPLDLALSPTDPFDVKGCWSGSATILPGNKPVILYTGADTQNRQVQNIATPTNLTDPFLREWTKSLHNPLMQPIDDINSSDFRDPTTGWLGEDGYWRVAVGGEMAKKGVAFLYRSKDFEHWVRAKDYLHSSSGSGMWECPDFYPVSLTSNEGLDTSTRDNGEVKHVLKMSLGETEADHYMVGGYNEDRDVFVPDNAADDRRMWPRYDYGIFYASKSFFDAEKKRRILWGWSKESDTGADDIAKGWSGIQTIPRAVWLDKNEKQLVQWPVKELESLRRKGVKYYDIQLESGALFQVKGIKASQADVEVDFELPSLEGVEPFDPAWRLDPQGLCGKEGVSVKGGIGPFGLLVLASYNLQEHTAIFFRVFKAQKEYVVLMCSDLRRSSFRQEIDKPSYGSFVDIDVEKDGKISLKTLIDHSVVESFGGGGRTCMTARVYPDLLLSGNSRIYAFNNGTEAVKISELKAWSMAKARIN